MKPIYEENEETLEIAEQISCHIPPQLHAFSPKARPQ